jgi:hypothetical protein
VNDAKWVLLSAIYHRVLAQSPAPEAAKIAISTARKNGQLRMRAAVHEYKARPDLRLAPGEQPPQIPPVIVPDHSVCSKDTFDHWDWEQSEASRRDSETQSLFWYRSIEANQEDALALWPEKAPVKSTATLATEPAWPGPQAKKPKDIGYKVWSVMKKLADMETEGIDLESIPQKELLELVTSRMASRMFGDARCSITTLFQARKAREKHKAGKARRR